MYFSRKFISLGILLFTSYSFAIAGKASLITGVQDIFYKVKDMNRAVKFYSEALGLTLVSNDGYWAKFAVEGVQVGLEWTEGDEIPGIPRDSYGAHAGGTLTLKSDDISLCRKQLEAAGAKILGQHDQPWGHILVFEDPDGNVVKIMKSN